MSRHKLLPGALRLLAALVVAGGVTVLKPEWWLALLAPVSGVVIDLCTPWLQSVTVRVEETMLWIEGAIRLSMTEANGGTLRELPAQWNRPGTAYLLTFVVACAAWAFPNASWRHRLAAFPLALALAALISAGAVTNDVQYTGLKAMGGGSLQHIELADTPETRAVLASLEKQFRRTTRIKAFRDAGGLLFLAALAGLAGYAVPLPRRPGRQAVGRQARK